MSNHIIGHPSRLSLPRPRILHPPSWHASNSVGLVSPSRALGNYTIEALNVALSITSDDVAVWSNEVNGLKRHSYRLLQLFASCPTPKLLGRKTQIPHASLPLLTLVALRGVRAQRWKWLAKGKRAIAPSEAPKWPHFGPCPPLEVHELWALSP